jgi:hypothetical protein
VYFSGRGMPHISHATSGASLGYEQTGHGQGGGGEEEEEPAPAPEPAPPEPAPEPAALPLDALMPVRRGMEEAAG